MYRRIASCLFLVGILSIGGCGPGGDATGDGNGGNSDGAAVGGVDESRLATPEDSIKYQFELLQAGDVGKLKACVTERQRERVTADSVEQGKKKVDGMTVDKLVGEIENGEYEGKKTATVKMPEGGRTLTTLIETDGKWLSDTIWFN